MKRLTTKEFIEKAKKIHGDRYDYSKVVYVNNKTKVTIVCPIHGDFEQVAGNHLNGSNCPICAGKTSLVQGVGINDLGCSSKSILYKKWNRMLTRCYSSKYHEQFPTYTDCEVCEDWKTLSKFKEWFDANYVEGYELDKDILVKGNKIYSPETCCFLPREINGFLTKSDKARGELPIGVCFYKPNGKYKSSIAIKGQIKHLGYFNSSNEAFKVYKHEKELHIRELALDYFSKNLIPNKVYEALLLYEVEEND